MSNTTTPTVGDARICFEPTLPEIYLWARHYRQHSSNIRAVAALRGWIDFLDTYSVARSEKRLTRIREAIGETSFQDAMNLADWETRRRLLSEGTVATPERLSADEWASIFPSVGAADLRSLREHHRSFMADKKFFGRSGI